MRWLDGDRMKRTLFVFIAIAGAAGVIAAAVSATQRLGKVDPQIVLLTMPPGYRNWKLISVAHEEGNLNDLRAILGNDDALCGIRGRLHPPDIAPPKIAARLGQAVQSHANSAPAMAPLVSRPPLICCGE